MTEYFRTADRLPTEADADAQGMIMIAVYGGPWLRGYWNGAKACDLWRRCQPSDYAPPKPREPRRVMRWRWWPPIGYGPFRKWPGQWPAECHTEDEAKAIQADYGGHYHAVSIIETLEGGW